MQSKCDIMLKGQKTTLLIGGSTWAESGDWQRVTESIAFCVQAERKNGAVKEDTSCMRIQKKSPSCGMRSSRKKFPELGRHRKTDDMVGHCASDREKVECDAKKSTGSSKAVCGSNHHGSDEPVENNRLVERVGISCEEEEAAQFARRDELEFRHKLAVLR